MTAAAIVTGNTVILKPSSDSPTIAAQVLSKSSKKPACPTASSTSAPAPAPPSATPSSSTPRPASSPSPAPKSVGLEIHERAATPSPARSGSSAPSSKWAAKIPSSSAQMPTSTPPSTASSPRPSASAAKSAPPAPAPSFEAPIYDVFVERLRERVATLTVGDPVDQSQHGPRHQQGGARLHARATSKPARRKARLVAGGNAVQTRRRRLLTFSPQSSPTSPPDAVIAQEEIFGPVLAVIKVESFEEGLARRQQHRVRPHRRPLHQRSAPKARPRAVLSTSAISTSIASAPAPWSARIPSAAST